jgi:hypothetical protein
MTKTKVVNIKEAQDFDVYIGRAGKGLDGYFGNPFKEQSRSKSVILFREYALQRIESDSEFRERVKELHGKTLGCFCKPKLCHGDVLAEIADRLVLEEDIFN